MLRLFHFALLIPHSLYFTCDRPLRQQRSVLYALFSSWSLKPSLTKVTPGEGPASVTDSLMPWRPPPKTFLKIRGRLPLKLLCEKYG